MAHLVRLPSAQEAGRQAYEDLGFCARGSGGAFIEEKTPISAAT
ncbi:MAG: hypothetical protein P8Y93_08615 [Acidobacteriota bacterium]